MGSEVACWWADLLTVGAGGGGGDDDSGDGEWVVLCAARVMQYSERCTIVNESEAYR